MGNNNCCVKNSDNSDGDDEDDGQFALASCRVVRPPATNLKGSNSNMMKRHKELDFTSVSKLRSSAMLPPLSMSKKLQIPKTPLDNRQQEQPPRSNSVLMQ